MSANQNNEEMALKSLRAELEQYLRTTRQRSRRMSVLLVVLVAALIAYLSVIYTKLSDVNAETATEIAYRRTLEYVQASPPVLSKALKDRAPEIFDVAETKMLEAPALVAAYIQRSAVANTQLVLNESEPRINQVITQAVEHAKASTARAGFDGNDPAQLDAMMTSLTDEIRTQLSGELNRLSAQYQMQAATLLAYMDKLAEGKNLDQRQTHVRNVIISFLAVAKKRELMQ